MTDVDAEITVARDDLRQLAEAVRAVWDIDLDRIRGRRPPLAAEEWEHEPGLARAAHPNLRRPNVRAVHGSEGSGIAQPAPWSPPGKGSVELAYVEATRELARAHRELMLRTDWPADDDKVGHGWVTDVHLRPVEAARVVPRDEVLRAVRGLSLGLEWARGQLDDLRAPERHGVLESCHHVGAALRHLEDFKPRGKPEPEQTKTCRNAPNGCPNQPRDGGTQCQTCVNYRGRHGHDRVVGPDGRALPCACKRSA